MSYEQITVGIALFGAITGAVSLGIVFYKTWKEKPRLSINTKNPYWYIHTDADPKFNIISIFTRIDNKGNNGTTIHSITLDFDNNGKPHTTPTIPDITLEIPPHSSIKKNIEFNNKRHQIRRRINKCQNDNELYAWAKTDRYS